MSLEWRLLDLERKNGLFNTALDITLLESVSSGGPPVIAITEWSPTVSLGCLQSTLDVNKEICERNGVSIVRRKSGGQAVYLDEEYLVFSMVGEPDMFPKDMDSLKKYFSQILLDLLHKENIPAEFYPMSNIVVRDGNKYRTLGNSGQVIKEKAVFMQGSIRLSLNNLDNMLNALKINGHSLHQYKQEIKRTLVSVNDYKSGLTKEDLKRSFFELIQEKYKIKFRRGELTEKERYRTNELSVQSPITDELHYKPMGICYLWLNGKGLVPEFDALLHYEPSPKERLTKIREVA